METALLANSSQTLSLYDKHQDITDMIVEQLEAGVIPWQKPWTAKGYKPLTLPFNYTTKNYYRGINIVLLWASAIKNKFPTNEWAGYLQWKEQNESTIKDANVTDIVHFRYVEKEVDGEIKKVGNLKTYKVYNRCQLKSYVPEKSKKEPLSSLITKIEIIDEFLANTHAVIEHHDGGPCYDAGTDKILMPYPETFVDTKTSTATEAYYASTIKELVRWTGAKNRLNREGGKWLGDQHNAVEELVAEFGAAFLCAGFGLARVEQQDHAGHIDHLLKVIKENNNSIFLAASGASKAVDYLNGLEPK